MFRSPPPHAPADVRSPSGKRGLTASIVIALTLFGMARIVATYSVFNQVYDEPFHITRGYDWWSGAPYEHVLHPPLGPIMLGAGPVLSGVREERSGDRRVDGNSILYSGNYWRTLSLARAGNLFFFVGAVWGIWWWCHRYGSQLCACAAVTMFVSLPAVLAHAGLATTDMAITATLCISLCAFQNWLDRGNWRNSCVLGAAWGLTLLSKHSAVVFLPAACLAAICLNIRFGIRPDAIASRLRQCGVALLVTILVVWAGYRFSFGCIQPDRPAADGPAGVTGAITGRLWSLPLPAPEYFRGLMELKQKNERGHAPFFGGNTQLLHGHWAFFPVVLAIKTPLSFLLLFLLGGVCAFRSSAAGPMRVPILAAALMLDVAMMSNINLGVRHVLPMYPLLCIGGGYGCCALWGSRNGTLVNRLDCIRTDTGPANDRPAWSRRRWILRCVALCLVASGYFTSVWTHPDYLAYFNILGGAHPEQIVVDSDLDWGQDLDRLHQEFESRGIHHAHLVYFGTAIPLQHGFVAEQVLAPQDRMTGWIAVSITELMTDTRYSWLKRHEPRARVGRSILLFFID